MDVKASAIALLVSVAALILIESSRAWPHVEEGRSILQGAVVVVPTDLRPQTPPSRVAVIVASGRGTVEWIESLTLFRNGRDLFEHHPNLGCCLPNRPVWAVRAHGQFF